jgi:hypothetical protein
MARHLLMPLPLLLLLLLLLLLGVLPGWLGPLGTQLHHSSSRGVSAVAAAGAAGGQGKLLRMSLQGRTLSAAAAARLLQQQLVLPVLQQLSVLQTRHLQQQQ